MLCRRSSELLILSQLHSLRLSSTCGSPRGSWKTKRQPGIPTCRRGSCSAAPKLFSGLQASSFCGRRTSVYARQQHDFSEEQVSTRCLGCISCSSSSMAVMSGPSIDSNGDIREDGGLGTMKRAQGLGPSIDREGNYRAVQAQGSVRR
uniref:Uncharacterized protein n=1 Tax=Hanusia phi TaxID=3032 RepID=A0A7S0I018_9CRYP|mmetsp:Transcript_7264/g.16617  ORF Transcript_7264/g.16617 Transcript_7264/m.16617 type:complete len:148 (+) Transcript_7264:179-622(+)